jgi:CheY-like chemotaxis protein
VIDDNPDTAESMQVMLQLLGHDVHVAGDGRRGIDLAASVRPDTVLLDIGLPEMNGYDVARAMRLQAWGHGVRLVAVTGWGQDHDRRLAQEAGFDAHLVKPVGLAELQRALLAPA